MGQAGSTQVAIIVRLYPGDYVPMRPDKSVVHNDAIRCPARALSRAHIDEQQTEQQNKSPIQISDFRAVSGLEFSEQERDEMIVRGQSALRAPRSRI